MNIKSPVCIGALGLLAAHSLMAQGLWGIRNYRDLIKIDPTSGNVIQTVPIVGVPAIWPKFTLAYHKGEGVFYGFAYATFFDVRLIRYELPSGQATDLGLLPDNRYFEGLEYVDFQNSLVASKGEFNAGSPRLGWLSTDKMFTEFLNNGGDNDALGYDSRRGILYSLDTTGESFSQDGFVIKINLTNSTETLVLDQDPAYHPVEDAFYSVFSGVLYRWRAPGGNTIEVSRVGNVPGQNASIRVLPLAYLDDGLPGGLLARWTADRTALDSVGGHGGRLFGGATYALGKFGQSFIFDGTNDHLRADTQIANHRAFTLSAWVSPSSDLEARGAVVCTRDGEIQYHPQNGFEISIWADRNGNYSGLGQRYFYGPTNRLVANRWSHVVLSVQSDDTARLFIDGLEVALPPRFTDGGLLSRLDTTIGGNWPRDLDFFKGRIDDVRAYGRALSPAEVARDYMFSPELRMDVQVSAVDICWNSRADRHYLIQYRSALTASQWLDLGEPIPGEGQQQCFADGADGHETRFYRVVELP